jgi:membrane protein DedA with SNARE-associated domain
VFDSAVFWAYLGIFASLVACGLGAPVPEEIPVVTGGVLVGHPENQLRWWIMLPVCIIGVVVGDGCLYTIGRLWGVRLLDVGWVKSKLLPPARLNEIQNNFHKYGVKILLFARLLPGIRSPIFITAGMMRLPLGKFLFADGIYAIPGVSLLFFLGYWFTDQFLEVIKDAKQNIQPIITLVVLTAVATYLLIHFMRRPVATGKPEELDELEPIVSQVTHIVSKHETHPPPPATEKGASQAANADGQAGSALPQAQHTSDPPRQLDAPSDSIPP